jgi:hypothetical protein
MSCKFFSDHLVVGLPSYWSVTLWSRPWGLKTLITFFGGRSLSTESTQSLRKVYRADMHRNGNRPDFSHGGQSFVKRCQAKDRTRAKHFAGFWVTGCPGNKHLKSGKGAGDAVKLDASSSERFSVARMTEINKPAGKSRVPASPFISASLPHTRSC